MCAPGVAISPPAVALSEPRGDHHGLLLRLCPGPPVKPPLPGPNGSEGKFVAYGGPGQTVPTEMVGRVALGPGDGNVLWVAIDPDYDYLALEGNRRRPRPGEKGYDPLYKDITANGYGGQPIMKCETYGVGGWPDTGRGEPIEVPVPGGTRLLALHDHVLLTGLYVTDNHHGIYADEYTSSFEYWRFFLKAGYVHAEFHPFERDKVRLIDQTPRGGRRHAVSAPLCEQVYSGTHAANFGKKGHLVDDAIRTRRTVSFRVHPEDPRPSPDHIVLLSRSDELQVGSGSVVSVQMVGGETSGYVEVTVQGEDFTNPFTYLATFQATWQNRNQAQTTVPQVLGRPRLDAGNRVRDADLVPVYSGRGTHVDDSRPRPGTTVTRQTRVTLVCPPSTGGGGGGDIR